jgi:uncharacterized protein
MPWSGLLPEEIARFESLSETECWQALADAPYGRLAVRAKDGVDIFPVNVTVNKRAIYFRSAPGSKLVDIVHASSVAFEVDGSQGLEHWSVVVRGTAERLIHDSDIRASGVLGLATLTSSSKWNYVRITPSSISGRRFTADEVEG